MHGESGTTCSFKHRQLQPHLSVIGVANFHIISSNRARCYGSLRYDKRYAWGKHGKYCRFRLPHSNPSIKIYSIQLVAYFCISTASDTSAANKMSDQLLQQTGPNVHEGLPRHASCIMGNGGYTALEYKVECDCSPLNPPACDAFSSSVPHANDACTSLVAHTQLKPETSTS